MIGITYPNVKSVKILWKNNSVNPIGAFNVSFESPAKYDMYLITYVEYDAGSFNQISTFVNENIFKTGATMKEDANGSGYPAGEGNQYSRKATLSSDNKMVAFTNGYYSGNHGSNEHSCIPTAIYGINL